MFVISDFYYQHNQITKTKINSWRCKMDGLLCNAHALSKRFGDEERVLFDQIEFHSHGLISGTTRKTLRNFRNIPDSDFVEIVNITPTENGGERLEKG